MYRDIWIILDVSNCQMFPEFPIKIAVIFRFSMPGNIGNFVEA